MPHYLSLSSQGMCSSSITTLEVIQITPCHFLYWEFKTPCIWSNDCCIKGDNHFPRSTSHAFVNTAQHTVGLCCQETLLVHVQLLSTKTLLAGLLPGQPLPSRWCCCQRFFLSRYRTWHLPLNFSEFEFHWVPTVSFLQPI